MPASKLPAQLTASSLFEGPPGADGTAGSTARPTPSASSTPAAILMDSALSTSAKFGTSGQSSLFLVLDFQPSSSVANGAVIPRLPSQKLENLTPGSFLQRVAAGTACRTPAQIRQEEAWLVFSTIA